MADLDIKKIKVFADAEKQEVVQEPDPIQEKPQRERREFIKTTEAARSTLTEAEKLEQIELLLHNSLKGEQIIRARIVAVTTNLEALLAQKNVDSPRTSMKAAAGKAKPGACAYAVLTLIKSEKLPLHYTKRHKE